MVSILLDKKKMENMLTRATKLYLISNQNASLSKLPTSNLACRRHSTMIVACICHARMRVNEILGAPGTLSLSSSLFEGSASTCRK